MSSCIVILKSGKRKGLVCDKKKCGIHVDKRVVEEEHGEELFNTIIYKDNKFRLCPLSRGKLQNELKIIYDNIQGHCNYIICKLILEEQSNKIVYYGNNKKYHGTVISYLQNDMFKINDVLPLLNMKIIKLEDSYVPLIYFLQDYSYSLNEKKNKP